VVWEGRAGASLAETLVAFLLTTLLVQLAWSVTLSVRRGADRLVQRAEALETERIGWMVLSQEVGAGTAGRDWVTEGARVLSLRAFRGLGEVCAPLSTRDAAVVRYSGIRLPEPAKDSLLLLSAAGTWHPVKLVSRVVDATPCPLWPGQAVERWQWGPPVTKPLLARVYERGSYHLEDRAVRYRLGAGGRQPLTPERLDHGGSAFTPGDGSLLLRMKVRTDGGAFWEWTRTLYRTDAQGG